MAYRKRLIDTAIAQQLGASGAVLLRGAKGCGKTETARHHSRSEIAIDDSPAVETAMQSDPGILLRGDVPRLVDEWQVQPRIWNTVRHEVDRRRAKGQFILTGSANPEETANLHSGVGRFGVLRMRTMTWHELGWSTGGISLRDVFDGKPVEPAASGMIETDLPLTASRLVIGGWPGNLDLDEDQAAMNNRNYFELLTEVDLSRVSDVRRDPVRVRRVLQSIARNIATECTVSTIAADAGGVDSPLSPVTVTDYLDALNRLMIEDDLIAWNPKIRSRARLRNAAKRHFADTSLAAAALGLTSDKLLGDLEYMGFLFESCVIHDIRIFAESMGAKLFHYRDSNGVEADAVIENADGSWAAIEIKLGFGGAEQGAKTLLALKNTVAAGKHCALIVVTGAGFAHKRDDGVYVIPFQALAP